MRSHNIVNICVDKYIFINFYYLSIIYLSLFGVKKVLIIKWYWNVAVIILYYTLRLDSC